tara:strand:+ start:2198 stop:2461 length:264 start_codon:yes stop_codon:yes gene_type:complete
MSTTTEKVQQLNNELYDAYHNNTSTTHQEVLGKLGQLKLLIKEVVSENRCTWCDQDNVKLKDKLSETEYQISGLCQDCQDATFKEVN